MQILYDLCNLSSSHTADFWVSVRSVILELIFTTSTSQGADEKFTIKGVGKCDQNIRSLHKQFYRNCKDHKTVILLLYIITHFLRIEESYEM